MKNEITLEERKKIQLEMLIEIDSFCRTHNIRYILAFGTLLGAIRHKGYIPWDDDVDISMPLEDMIRFKKEFRSDKLKYIDADVEKGYEYHFSRITHKQSYSIVGAYGKLYGVNIDLYPIIEVSSDIDTNKKAIEQLRPILKKRLAMIRLRNIIAKFIPISTVLGLKNSACKYRDTSIKLLECKGGGAFHCFAGPLDKFELHTFSFNPFEEIYEAEFEGYKLMAPVKYHEYLTKRYGDYMQLPPEDQRHPYHGGKYYWK